MNKFFIIALLGLSVVLACHQSCNCAANSNVCNSCVFPGASVDTDTKRFCACPKGHFLQSLSPYNCQKLENTNAQGNDASVEMDACHIEIGRNAQTVKVNTDCHFENVGGKSYVVSNVSLNFNQVGMLAECKDAYVTSILIQDGVNGPYVLLDAKYVTAGPQGSQSLRFPLIDIYSLNVDQQVTNDQIIQTVNLKILIGHSDAVVRRHRWTLYVYTNRDQVETFVIDVDVQETEGCQPGQECIIVADLDTVGTVYTNGSFNVKKTDALKYLVGDYFYAKITFADPTYTKQLSFQKLYFKNGANKIFNFSSITHYEWKNGGLEFYLPLVEPTQQAVIQITMKITTDNARFLASSVEKSVQQQFKLDVAENNSAPADNNTTQTTNAMVLLFGLMNLALLFLF